VELDDDDFVELGCHLVDEKSSSSSSTAIY